MDYVFLFKKPVRKRGAAKPWQPGDAFKRLTGKSIAECKTIDDIDAAVVRALRMKGPLPFDTGTSTGLVVRSGDVFPHSAESAESIAKRIDSAIGMSVR